MNGVRHRLSSYVLAEVTGMIQRVLAYSAASRSQNIFELSLQRFCRLAPKCLCDFFDALTRANHQHPRQGSKQLGRDAHIGVPQSGFLEEKANLRLRFQPAILAGEEILGWPARNAGIDHISIPKQPSNDGGR
jgi:hypothetical protein